MEDKQHSEGEALFEQGKAYFLGEGCEVDYEKAFGFFKRSAELGYPDGIRIIAQCYEEGSGVDASRDMARQWYEKALAAAPEDEVILCNYGLFLLDDYSEESDAKAFKLLEKGAKTGESMCINNLGLCYMNGRGVKQDQKKGYQLYKKAAKMHNYRAMLNVYVARRNGYGVRKSRLLAFHVLIKNTVTCFLNPEIVTQWKK